MQRPASVYIFASALFLAVITSLLYTETTGRLVRSFRLRWTFEESAIDAWISLLLQPGELREIWITERNATTKNSDGQRIWRMQGQNFDVAAPRSKRLLRLPLHADRFDRNATYGYRFAANPSIVPTLDHEDEYWLLTQIATGSYTRPRFQEVEYDDGGYGWAYLQIIDRIRISGELDFSVVEPDVATLAPGTLGLDARLMRGRGGRLVGFSGEVDRGIALLDANWNSIGRVQPRYDDPLTSVSKNWQIFDHDVGNPSLLAHFCPATMLDWCVAVRRF